MAITAYAVGFCLRPIRLDAHGLQEHDYAKLGLIAAASEAALGTPPIQALARRGPNNWEAVYVKASDCLQVLQVLHESMDEFPFAVGLSLAPHNTKDPEGLTLPSPQTLIRARWAAAHTGNAEARWIAITGFGAWDSIGTVILNLVHSVRLQRSYYERQVAAHLRNFDSVAQAASQNPPGTPTQFKRAANGAGITESWRAEALIAQYLDGFAVGLPKWP